MKMLIRYLIVAIISILFYKYCIYKNKNQYSEQIYIAKNTERILVYVYLVKKNNNLLKEYIRGMLQDYIIWLSKEKIKDKDIICSIIHDDELKKDLIKGKEKRLEDAINKINKTCNSGE